MFKWLSMVSLIFLLGWPFPAKAETIYQVNNGYVCLKPTMLELAEISKQRNVGMADLTPLVEVELCWGIPSSMNMDIREVHSEAYIDWEGDTFYVVRVGDKVWTAAFPGFNSNLPKLSLMGT